MNRKLVFALSLFVLLCSSLYVRFNSVRAKSSNGYAVAPLFTLTDIEGNIVTLENLTGKIVVLDFFYPQCQYSDDQIVHLEEIYEKYTRDELEIISISPKEIPIEDLEEFKTGPNRFSDLEYEISWIIARDTETQNVTAKYNISGYPTTVIIDQEGFVSPKSPFVGLTMPSTLSQEIEDLLLWFQSFNTSLDKCVNVVSNSTIEDFQYFQDNSTIKMYASNMTSNQTCGFCRVTIPHALMNVTNIEVIIDNGTTALLYHNYALYNNGTHRWIYFAYEHSTHEIYIIPEFPSFIILPLFMIATLLSVLVYKKRAKSARFTIAGLFCHFFHKP